MATLDDDALEATDAAGGAVSGSSLWRNPDFLILWSGQSVSALGSEITPIALPLLATITLHAAPAQMAVLRALSYAPAIVVGLFAGAWVDRVRRRPLLIGSDVGRGVLLAAIPVATAAGLMRMDILYLIAFLLGVLGVVFGAAYGAYLPAILPREQLVAANSRTATSDAAARIAGPGLGGLLVQALTAPGAIAIDGLSFLVSAASLALIRAPEPVRSRADGAPNIWAEIGEGLRVLGADAILRAFVLSSATLDIFWNAIMAVYFLYLTRALDLPAGAFGLIFGIGSAGALLGSLVAGRAAQRLGVGQTVIVAQVVIGLGGLLIALAIGLHSLALPLLVAAEVVQGGAGAVFGITRGSLQQTIVPDRLRGRVGASANILGFCAVVLGSILGGVMGERIGLPATMVMGACGGVLAFLWLLCSPLRALRVA